MQNRFKFRIWNGSEMHYNDFVVTSTGFIGKIIEEFLGNCVFNQEDLTADKECILMQSTGLKDKNGKLIYESDVVKDDHEALHQVKWCYNCFELYPLFKNGYTIGIVNDEIEVIGNIYENKEILNEI